MASITWGILLCAAVLCGGSEINFQKSGRIIGGETTSIEKFPWIVQIDFQHNWQYTWSQTCGGIILTSTWVLSAAHCFDGRSYAIYRRRIRAGATQRDFGGFISYCTKRIKHPSFNPAYTGSAEGDITVVQIERPLVWSDFIKAGTIAAPNSVIPKDTPVVLVGWGRTDVNGNYSDVLQQVTTRVVDHDLCVRRYAEEHLPITKSMICAGALDIGGVDSCDGDSGGPLIYDKIVIGITSFGMECADPYFPGVSTAVASYTEWIIKSINN